MSLEFSGPIVILVTYPTLMYATIVMQTKFNVIQILQTFHFIMPLWFVSLKSRNFIILVVCLDNL